MKARKKLNSRAGFTLAETLLAVTILLLVSSIVVTGMPAAKNAYEKVVLASNAEVMLATAESALRDELGTAWKVQKVSESTSITYYSADTGMRTKLEMKDKDLSITEYEDSASGDPVELLIGIKRDTTNTFKTSRKLVYQAPKDLVQMHVQAKFTVSQDEKTGQFMVIVSDLCVVNDKGDKLASWKGKNGNTATTFTIPVFSVVTPNSEIQTQ